MGAEMSLRTACLLPSPLGRGERLNTDQVDVRLWEGCPQTAIYSTTTRLTVSLQNGTGHSPGLSVSTTNSSCERIMSRNQSCASRASSIGYCDETNSHAGTRRSLRVQREGRLLRNLSERSMGT